MAAQDSDSEEDFVTYGKPLEQYEEGEQPKKPIPLHDQTVKDEKGRYKRFHGAFTGGFSAGYFNTVGSKGGWAPSTFVSSRQGRSERTVSRPEDFMDEDDLGEFGIAPKQIVTTEDFASKSKDRIREKARELASVSAPIPGATILDDLIAPAKITIGIQLLRQMGWKEGQGVGPRTKRRAQKQKPESCVRMYACALPPMGSEGSEDEEDEYVPENVTFAPKDVIPIDFTIKDNVHGLGYRGLDPSQALFGSQNKHIHLFGDGNEETNSLLGDYKHSRGRKVGMSGQAFGVGVLEEEDDDIYGRESLSKYDTVLREEESGDGLFGWTAPKEYRNSKGLHKQLMYVGKILDGYCAAMKPTASKKVYAPPELPKDYRPVHYFRPVLASNQTSPALQALLDASQKPPSLLPDATAKQSRHHLNSDQRREMLGETPLQGPASVLELLSEKDRERIQDMKHAVEQQRVKAQKLADEAVKRRSAEEKLQESLQTRMLVPTHSGDFQPFEKNPEKQKRYETYVRNLHKDQKDALENCLDENMTEWEREREQEEFMRSAMLYKPSSSTLSSRFTRAKYDDNTDKVEVPRDQESDVGDKAAAVKMKMFGKLTRDTFEWHPDKLLCKRFNIPDPYSGSTLVGLPKVKRDKFSVFNFLTIPENPKPHESSMKKELLKPSATENKPKKLSRWDVSGRAQEETVSDVNKQIPDPTTKEMNKATATLPSKITIEETDKISEDEEKRPPIDLFKAIFEDSSDEKSSSSEEESGEEEEETLPITNSQRAEPMTSRAPEPEIQEPVLSVAPKVKVVPEKILPEEEFGPKLPPTLPSSASGGNTFTPFTVSDESVKKQKHNKKDKEKHKLKKGHKHKKEKKKKHKKQKHKNKHRSKKAEDKNSDSEDSNTSLSDMEHTTDLTPKELLKRLKNLPIPR